MKGSEIMLKLILGRAASGKTTYLRSLLAEKTMTGKKCCLIVPEQFSFESERAVIELLGAKKSNEIQILSFSSLAKKVLNEYAPIRKPSVSNAVKAVIMSIAMESVGSEPEIFRGCTKNGKMVSELLKMSDELIQWGVSGSELTAAAEKSGNEILIKKANELSLASSMYESLLQSRFSDDRYMINAAADIIAERKLFENSLVFFDEFTGFTPQENLIVAEILKQADEVYVTQCAEGITETTDGTGPFAYAVSNIRKLIGLCNKYGVKIAEPVVMNAEGHWHSPAIAAVERGIYVPVPEIYKEKTADVVTAAAKNPYEECLFVAMTAKKLVREKNLRYRDIVVVSRDSSYRKYLPFAFKKYDIPVFEDTRHSLSDELIVRYALSALSLAAEGFKTDTVMRMIKTYLFGMSPEDIAALENYVLLWQIDYSGWQSEWEMHPDGYGKETSDEDKEKQKYLNSLRETVVSSINEFRDDLKDKDGFGCTKAVYDFLIKTAADKNLLAIAKSVEKPLAAECERSWNEFMNTLSLLADTIGTAKISPARYSELFKIMVSTSDMGDIPSGLDEITIGDADRIRVADKKVLFVVGANEGVFPADTSPSFVLTENERRLLKNQGLELGDNSTLRMQKERLRVYSVLSIPSDMLFVCYSLGNFQGMQMSPSEIVGMINKIVPGAEKIEISLLPPDYSVESARSAFEGAASHFSDNSVFSSSVKKCLADNAAFEDKLKSVERLCKNEPFEFKDTGKSTELFGRNMYISPSRVENYYKCPFQYFCKYGVYAKPIRVASFDSSQNGLAVHFVLEKIFASYGSDGIAAFSEDEMKKITEKFTLEYINTHMGGINSLTKRVQYSMKRCQGNIFEILRNLAMEFRSGKFKTRDVELQISSSGQVPPYMIDIGDGGSVYLSGIVDRVDTMETDKTYLRVVDYKTGAKEFKLEDIMSGLNIQMLVYLVCLFENGKERYGDVAPAGVLYVPAKGGKNTLPRNADGKAVEDERIKQRRMNGIVLADEDVIRGMEESGGGLIINARISDKGVITGSTFDIHQFALLHKKIDDIAADMALSLHKGKIDALPITGGNYSRTCQYCDYKAVCCHEENDGYRSVFKGDVWEALEEEYTAGDESKTEEVFGNE
ncbi:MAG: PD-(D/E)XK nuclease family protein [Clostridiales bacterium]|nr:PD-(D/E)XK nuclease family protein [Clostridiales bacterium]